MIVENPYTQPHYLTTYFPIRPKVIVPDRHAEGDYFKKPTQFFFLNCEPEQNIVFEPIKHIDIVKHNRAQLMNNGQTRQVCRSLIHPQFADRFIKTYLLTKDDHIWM